MTDVYILLKNFNDEGWKICSISDNFENTYEDAKNHALDFGADKCTKYCVEHWQLENDAYLGTTVLNF